MYLEKIVKLASQPRTVKTPEGADRYNVPIGSKIGTDSEDNSGRSRPVTIERLKSLQSQLETARKVGDTSILKKVGREFALALQEYAADRTASEVMTELQTAVARPKQA